VTSLQGVTWHRNMFFFVLLLETGEFNYWSKREVRLHFFLSHLYCVPLTSVIWERKRKMVIYGVNAWFQSKYFLSYIYLFGISSKCGGFFLKQIPLVTQQLLSISFLLTVFVLIYCLIFRHRSHQWEVFFLIHYHLCGFEISG